MNHLAHLFLAQSDINLLVGNYIADHVKGKQIEEFSSDAGDIKAIWELSRMSWVAFLASNFRLGDKKSIDLINTLLSDWDDKNPFLIGPNWVCGQEVGFRGARPAALSG